MSRMICKTDPWAARIVRGISVSHVRPDRKQERGKVKIVQKEMSCMRPGATSAGLKEKNLQLKKEEIQRGFPFLSTWGKVQGAPMNGEMSMHKIGDFLTPAATC